MRLLVKFFINTANDGYLRGLATEMHENTNAIRKELNNLSEAGFIIRDEQESKIIYDSFVSKGQKNNPLKNHGKQNLFTGKKEKKLEEIKNKKIIKAKKAFNFENGVLNISKGMISKIGKK